VLNTNGSIADGSGGRPTTGYLERSWRPHDGGVGAPLDLRLLFRLLNWRARLVGGVVLAAILLAVAILALVPATYTATAVVLLDPRQTRVTASEAVLAGIGSDAAAVESQVELVQSSVLARQVIEQLHLDADPEFNSPSLLDDLKAALGWGSNTAESRASQLLAKFQKSLSVRRRGLTYILEIDYSSDDPKRAATIANAVAKAYIVSQQELKNDLTRGVSDWLDGRLDVMRKRVQKSEQAVADYKSEHHIVDVTQGNKLIARRMEDVSQQLAVAQLRKAEVGGRLKEVQAAAKQEHNADALADILQSQTIGNLRGQYAAAARLEAQYRAIYGSNHPFLVAAREQLAELQNQIDQEVARVIDGLRADYAAASRQQAELESQLGELSQKAQNFDQANVPLAALSREAEADRALLEQYLGRLKETHQEQTQNFTDARVVSPALQPLKPNRPGAILIVLAAGMCGLIFGVGLMLLLEHLRRGLRTPDDVAQALGLPCLGTIPNLNSRRILGPRPWQSRAARDKHVALATFEYTRSVSATATRLRRSSSQGSEVMAIASALPAEGKSTFACNVARATAAAGVRTLLIDGDGYCRGVSRMFGIDGPGLRELSENQSESWDVAVSEVSSGLYVVGTGNTHGPRFHDFDTAAVAAVLEEFKQYFDLIVVDTPAILPTGGGRLIECADRIVMIAEWDRTDRAAVSDALAMLGPHESDVAGVVLNKASLRWYRLFAQGNYQPGQYSTGSDALVLPSP